MFWLYLIISIVVLTASIVSARDSEKVVAFFSVLLGGAVAGAIAFFFITMIASAIVGQHQEHTTTHVLERVDGQYAKTDGTSLSWYQNDKGVITVHDVYSYNASIVKTHDKPYVEYFQPRSNNDFWSLYNGQNDSTVVLHIPDVVIP
jgi:hypothetical protein